VPALALELELELELAQVGQRVVPPLVVRQARAPELSAEVRVREASLAQGGQRVAPLAPELSAEARAV